MVPAVVMMMTISLPVAATVVVTISLSVSATVVVSLTHCSTALAVVHAIATSVTVMVAVVIVASVSVAIAIFLVVSSTGIAGEERGNRKNGTCQCQNRDPCKPLCYTFHFAFLLFGHCFHHLLPAQ
jgi:hypothetical protein